MEIERPAGVITQQSVDELRAAIREKERLIDAQQAKIQSLQDQLLENQKSIREYETKISEREQACLSERNY